MLVDTSVWVDHLRRGNDLLAARLRAGEVWTHPFVIGELACGTLERRREILGLLAALPHAPLLDHQEVLDFVESRQLMAQGLGGSMSTCSPRPRSAASPSGRLTGDSTRRHVACG